MWIYNVHALRIEHYVRWKGELENFTALCVGDDATSYLTLYFRWRLLSFYFYCNNMSHLLGFESTLESPYLLLHVRVSNTLHAGKDIPGCFLDLIGFGNVVDREWLHSLLAFSTRLVL